MTTAGLHAPLKCGRSDVCVVLLLLLSSLLLWGSY